MKKLNSFNIPILKYTTSTVEFWIIISILLFLVIAMTKTLLFAPSADMVAFMTCAAHFGTLLGGIGTLGLLYVAWKAQNTWKQEISFGHILDAKKNLLSTMAEINSATKATLAEISKKEIQEPYPRTPFPHLVKSNLSRISVLESELIRTFTVFEVLLPLQQGEDKSLTDTYDKTISSYKTIYPLSRHEHAPDSANYVSLQTSHNEIKTQLNIFATNLTELITLIKLTKVS